MAVETVDLARFQFAMTSIYHFLSDAQLARTHGKPKPQVGRRRDLFVPAQLKGKQGVSSDGGGEKGPPGFLGALGGLLRPPGIVRCVAPAQYVRG
jgi:hypothetical protein